MNAETKAKPSTNVALVEPERGAMTPMQMLHHAITQGSNVEVMEKLLLLQERWEKNQARKEFDEAVAAAKAEIPVIIRNREGHNSKRYVDFAAIAKVVDPIIANHGLSYRFRTQQGDKINVTCVLSHRAGHSEETTLSGPADNTGNKNAIQAIGSTLTYLQRYSLIQALGLAAGDDDDGAAAINGGTITDEQAAQIRQALEFKNAPEQKFILWVSKLAKRDIAQLEDIPAQHFDACVSAIAKYGTA